MREAIAPTVVGMVDTDHNVPDWGTEESRRLEREFNGLDANIAELLNEARALPERIELGDVETANKFTVLIGRFVDLDKKVESYRNSEKAPHLRRGDAVDSFFFRMRERLLRRNKKDPAGGGDVIQARLHNYNERRLAEEQRLRDEAARAAQEEENRLRREREEQERIQREADQRAARARNEENKRRAEEQARDAAREAQRIRDEEEAARSAAAETRAAAAAKPADKVRERHEDGAMNTMRREGFAEIVDAMKLDPVKLWPFVPLAAKETALKNWAKTTGHTEQMTGAEIGFRNKTVVRR